MQLKRWSEAIALRMANARLRKAKKLIEEVAYLYGDVDNCVVDRCGDLIDLAEQVRLEIVEGAQARVEEREEAA